MTTVEINKWKQAFCIAIALTIALVFYLIWNIESGYWIAMTVGLMFLATDQGQGAIVIKARDRAVGTILGLCLAFLFVSDLMYFSYRWAYALPLVLFIGTYLFYATNNYTFWTMTITMLVAICASTTIPTEFSLGAVLFIRFFCTYAGIVLALVCEFAFFKNASSIKPTLKSQLKDYFLSQSELIILATDEFLTSEGRKETFSKALSSQIWQHITQMVSIETNFAFAQYEFDKKSDRSIDYDIFFTSVLKISSLSRKVLSIAGHEDNQKTKIEIEIISQLSKIVSNTYSYRYKENELIEKQKEAYSNLDRIKNFQKIYPSSFLFCKILCNMIDDFIDKKYLTYFA